MTTPYLSIDLGKIEHNAREIVGQFRSHGITVTGVTKGVCGHPEVAKAMLRGGVSSIGDSRLPNIHRLRAAGVRADCWLLRVSALSVVDEVVGSVEVSLESELSVLGALSHAAKQRGRVHDVILMVELGDLREGIPPDDLIPFVREAIAFPDIQMIGLGTNLACFGGVIPDRGKMDRLVELAHEIEDTFGLALRWISGLNSSGLEILVSGDLPPNVNHARIGEAILLGRETIHRKPWPDTFQDAFVLRAEVLELKTKPSVPDGDLGEDAFGHRPDFDDRGERARALLNVGREDVDPNGITPSDPRLRIQGASSGYLVLDVTDAEDGIRVGDQIAFSVSYSALLRAMTSEYVSKHTFPDDGKSESPAGS